MLLVLVSTASLPAADLKLAKPPAAGVAAVNETELRMHLEFLASPQLGGRYTLSPGFDIAAQYLATRLKAYGYKGAAADGSFFQKHDLTISKADAEKSSLSFTIDGQKQTVPYGDFYNAGSMTGAASGKIVFVGYGISSPAQKHDDYAGIDAKGKIVMIVSGMPAGIDSSRLKDSESDMEAAVAHGAVGMIRVPSTQLVAAMANPGFKERALRQESIRLTLSKEKRIPGVRVAPAVLNKILAKLDLTVEKIHATAKEKGAFKPRDVDASAEMNVAAIHEVKSTQNVIGKLEGTDAMLKDQHILISAHYDHLKTNAKGQIYPGADDDGSGTVAILNIARAFSLQAPKRSVVAIFHAGEELGLLGSEFNSDIEPAVPLDKIVVNLNIDMIGRSKAAGDTKKANEQLTDANSIYVVGADKISKRLHDIQEQTNKEFEKLRLDYLYNDPNHPERIYFRSDHWNYAKHGVPVIFYFDGVSEDYHQPTDTVDKIDFKKLERVTKLVYRIGWRLANMPGGLPKDAVKK